MKTETIKTMTADDRLWNLIRKAGQRSPLFRVRVESGDIPHASCPKPLMSKGYVVGGWRVADRNRPFEVGELIEGESMPVRMHYIVGDRGEEWMGCLEKFVEEMAKLPGGRVLCFYISRGGVGRYNEISAGVCAYDAA